MNGQQSPIIEIDQASIANGPQSHESNAFRNGLAIGDNHGFIVTDLSTHKLKYPEILAAVDSAADAVPRFGDTPNNQASSIRFGRRFAGGTQVVKIGRMPCPLKMRYKDLFFKTRGKMPSRENDTSELPAERPFS